MSYLIPTWELTLDRKRHLKTLIKSSLSQAAKSLWFSGSEDKPFIRELLPLDLGLAAWITPKAEGITSIPWVDHEIDVDKVISFYKVVQLSEQPRVNAITILYEKPKSIFIYQLEQLYSLIPVLKRIKELNGLEQLGIQYGMHNLMLEGWFDEPFAMLPNTKIKIDITYQSNEISNGDRLMLVGFTAEAKIAK